MWIYSFPSALKETGTRIFSDDGNRCVTILQQARPICFSMMRDWLMLIPDINMPKLTITFPAGYFPNKDGWLLHLNCRSLPQALHVCMTIAIEPFLLTSTSGLGVLQLKQNICKIETSMLRNTTNFGSSAGWIPGSTLKMKQQTTIYKLYKFANSSMQK